MLADYRSQFSRHLVPLTSTSAMVLNSLSSQVIVFEACRFQIDKDWCLIYFKHSFHVEPALVEAGFCRAVMRLQEMTLAES